jgi:hypothetical protein
VIRELIDVASGAVAHLPPDRAAELHAAVTEDETAAADTAAAVTGPDVSPEPADPASVPAEPARVF